jgi:hypothetical protein
LTRRIEELERSMPGVLQVGVVLVHEAPAVAIDEYPAHRHIFPQALGRVPVGKALEADAERVVGIRMAKAI